MTILFLKSEVLLQNLDTIQLHSVIPNLPCRQARFGIRMLKQVQHDKLSENTE